MSQEELEWCDFSGLYTVTCTHCSGNQKYHRGGYTYHDDKQGVVLESKRPYVPGLAIWYPYGDKPIPLHAGTVHVAGGWSFGHISELIEKHTKLWMIEFAPSHKELMDEGWLNLLSQEGIGLQFRRHRPSR